MVLPHRAAQLCFVGERKDSCPLIVRCSFLVDQIVPKRHQKNAGIAIRDPITGTGADHRVKSEAFDNRSSFPAGMGQILSWLILIAPHRHSRGRRCTPLPGAFVPATSSADFRRSLLRSRQFHLPL
jgi:hypothetical protein